MQLPQRMPEPTYTEYLEYEGVYMNIPKSSRRSCIVAIGEVLYHDQGPFDHLSAALYSHIDDCYLALPALGNTIFVQCFISLRSGAR